MGNTLKTANFYSELTAPIKRMSLADAQFMKCESMNLIIRLN